MKTRIEVAYEKATEAQDLATTACSRATELAETLAWSPTPDTAPFAKVLVDGSLRMDGHRYTREQAEGLARFLRHYYLLDPSETRCVRCGAEHVVSTGA